MKGGHADYQARSYTRAVPMLIALLVACESYRVSTPVSTGAAAGLQRAALTTVQRIAGPVVMVEVPSPVPEATDEPEPAYGTEAYFAKQKAAKGIKVPEGDGRGGFFQIFGGEQNGPPPPPAKTIAEVSRLSSALTRRFHLLFHPTLPNSHTQAFPNVLSAEERSVLVGAMKTNGLTNFGAAFAKPDTNWDGVRAAQPLLGERSDKELYDAYMEQTTFKGFGSLFSGGG